VSRLFAQWVEVHRRRETFWRQVVDEVGGESATEMLRAWGTAAGEDPEALPDAQLSLFEG
jgi:hypothetical protein